MFPKGESVENKHDRKIWWWKECIDDAIEAGLKMATIEFWVYYKIRVYETHGKYGYSVASEQTLADDVGMGVTAAQVKNALMHLRAEGKLAHLVCDKRIYRNKTTLDVTNKWCKKHNIDPTVFMVGNRGAQPKERLGEVVKSEPESSESEPESSDSSLMNKYKNESKMNNAGGTGNEKINSKILFSRLCSEFKRADFQIVNKKQLKEKLERLLEVLEEDESTLEVEDIITAARNYIGGTWENKSLQHFLSPNVFSYCVVKKNDGSNAQLGGFVKWEN